MIELPENFEIGDIVQAIQFRDAGYANYWLPHVENECGVVTRTEWGMEVVMVYWSNNKLNDHRDKDYLMKAFKIVKKGTPTMKKYIKLVYGDACP
jgi:hypothetical protein